jgi:transposase
MADMATKGTGRGRTARPRRRFAEEYKAEAVRLVLDEKRAMREVARSLGISPTAINRWVAKEEKRRGVAPPPPPITVTLSPDERAELEQLRRRVRELETDKAILKKAAAFFARENG